MQQYNTIKESNNEAMTTQSPKAAAKFEYTMKGGISQNSESILRALFNALFVADRHGIKTDHSPSNTEVMTLDLYQIQQMIRNHCDTLYTQMDIVDALFGLASPQLIHSPATTAFISELDGKRVDAVQLEYSGQEAPPMGCKSIGDAMKRLSQNPKHLYIPPNNAAGQTKLKPTPIWPEFKLHIPELDDCGDSCVEALDLWHANLAKFCWTKKEPLYGQNRPLVLDALYKKCAHLEYQNKLLEHEQKLYKNSMKNLMADLDSKEETIDEFKQSKSRLEKSRADWKAKAFKNHENYEIAQATIAALRSTIMELTETLHAADSEARISLTSRELLQLMTANSDSNDLSF